MLELWSDYEAVKFTNWPHVSSLQECQERLDRVLEHYRKNPLHFGPYVIRIAGGQFAGILGADASEAPPGPYEVWYFVGRRQWRKGIATAALTELLRHMAASGRVTLAFATAVCDNHASWGLLEKLEFRRQERILNGHQRHGLTLDVFKYALLI
jgi:RimJ/RimL family protein N-acetyltransferase